MNKIKKSVLSLVLAILLTPGLMPGMSLTAYADNQKAYAAYDVTTNDNKTKSGDALTALQVKFNGKSWYIIADDSTAVNAGTVTLLAAESFGNSKFHDSSNKYSTSTIKTTLYNMTASGGSFAGVASAINTVKVKGSESDTEVDAKLYLLNTTEASNVPENVRKFSTEWWLRSPGWSDYTAAFVDSGSGFVVGDGGLVDEEFGVRPALKLNLSSAIFSSESKTFSLKTAGYSVTLSGGANATTSGGATSQTGLTGAMTTVTYTANTGYYFAEFADISSNGITARRTSSTVVTASGTPTADATITVPDAVAIPTYEVTYKVVNGTWSDGSTTDRKETVQSGSKPASVPTGMKASSGYTGGAWDTDPAETTITEAKTFTYTFTTKQAAPAPTPQETEAPAPTQPSTETTVQEPITIPKTPASAKTKVKKNKVTVTWKNIKKTKKTKTLIGKIKYIQIQYSTDKAFRKNAVKKKVRKNKTKATYTLQKNTTYYIRIRYVGKDGVSKWTKAKKVKTKK